MAKRFTIEAVFKMIDGVTAPIDRIQNRMQKFTRSTFRGITRVNRSVDKLSRSLRNMAVVGGAAAVTVGFGLKKLVDIGANFGRSIGVAAGVFQEGIERNSKEFKALEDIALKVGANTEFTAVQAADGLAKLARAGFKSVEAIDALPVIVDFATASQLDFATAANIAADALGAFGLSGNSPQEKLIGLNRVIDVMSKTANSSNTRVDELFESIKKGGPVIRSAGGDIETYAAVMAFLASRSIKGGTSGIAMKNIVLALSGVGNQAAKIFKRLGIELGITAENLDKVTEAGTGARDNASKRIVGDLRDQLGALDELRDKLADMGSRERVPIIAGIFGKIPLASVALILEKEGTTIRDFRAEVDKAGGSTKILADFIRKDVRGSIDMLVSAVTNTNISIFKLNEGPLKTALDRMTKWVRVNEDLIAGKIGNFLLMIIDNLDNIVTWIKNIAIGLAVFIAFTTVLKTVVLVMTAFNLVMAINPLGLLIIGAGLLIAAFASLFIWTDDIIKVFEGLPAPIRLALLPLELLIRALKQAKDLAKFGFNIVTDTGKKTADLISPVTDAFFAANDKAVSFLDSLFSEASKPIPQIVNSQERVERSITERNNNTTSEIVVRAEGGTGAEIVTNGLGSNLKLEHSGGF